jgi:hypothetical protein
LPKKKALVVVSSSSAKPAAVIHDSRSKVDYESAAWTLQQRPAISHGFLILTG